MAEVVQTQCCIAGCGPAGAMLGLLLARQGVDVLVLEKHADFLRDFRGDTLHPASLEIMDQLGLADRLLQLRHTRVDHLALQTPGGPVTLADFTRLPTRFPFITLMPQWDFLDFLTREARRYPSFHLEMRAEARALLLEDGRVRGLRYAAPDGEREARALLTVGADGRTSVVRERAGLRPVSTAPPMDVLWFRLSKPPSDPEQTALRTGPGRLLLFVNRGDYWQVAYVIPKGAAERVRAAGLEAFRRALRDLAPDLGDRPDELRDWEQVKLLSVQSNRLRRWYRPGLLCIGDAAHAMSPVGGVGINLAIQDAVAAANLLAGPLAAGALRTEQLARVQRQRELPTRAIQAFQWVLQQRLVAPALRSTTGLRLPGPLLALLRHPVTGRVATGLAGRLIGLGVGRARVQAAGG